jgi:acetyl esterase/lipase
MWRTLCVCYTSAAGESCTDAEVSLFIRMATISPAPPDRSRHSYLNDLVARSGAIGMSVYYRLAPEHKLPAAYDDAWAALRWAVTLGEDPWLLEHADLSRVFLAGCNADANIAHDTAVRVSAAGVAIRVCWCLWPRTTSCSK